MCALTKIEEDLAENIEGHDSGRPVCAEKMLIGSTDDNEKHEEPEKPINLD